MKYLIVVLVIAAVLWLVLQGRKREKAAPRKAARARSPQAMLQCVHCGLHLPQAEAVVDERGAFCSEAHRLAGPRRD